MGVREEEGEKKKIQFAGRKRNARINQRRLPGFEVRGG